LEGIYFITLPVAAVAFKYISVTGNTTITADSATDQVYFAGGGGLTASTSGGTTVTISHSTAGGQRHIPDGGSSGDTLVWAQNGNAAWTSAGGGGGGSGEANEYSFKYVVASGSGTATADTDTDTLTLVGGTGITVALDSADTISFALSSGSSSTTTSSEAHTTGSHAHTLGAGHNHTVGTQYRAAYWNSSTDIIAAGFYASSNTWGSTSNEIYSTATFKLYVENDVIQFSGLATGSGSTMYVTSGGRVVKSGSARVYKENIEDLNFTTSSLYDLVPRSFKYKDHQETIHEEGDDPEPEEIITVIGKQSFGLIAEEVNEFLPDLVLKNADGEPDDIQYPLLSVLLLEEMKKLKARIEVLEGNG